MLLATAAMRVSYTLFVESLTKLMPLRVEPGNSQNLNEVAGNWVGEAAAEPNPVATSGSAGSSPSPKTYGV